MFDQVYQDIKKNVVEQWDYSPAFPAGWAGALGPVVVDSANWQLDPQMQAITNQGQWTQPVFSIELAPSPAGVGTRFGDVYGVNMPNQAPGTTLRLGNRFRVPVLIGIWVDQQLGGLPFARKLAAQVFGAMFYYRNRLTTIRHIDFIRNKENQVGQAQEWWIDCVYEGDVFVTIDV